MFKRFSFIFLVIAFAVASLTMLEPLRELTFQLALVADPTGDGTFTGPDFFKGLIVLVAFIYIPLNLFSYLAWPAMVIATVYAVALFAVAVKARVKARLRQPQRHQIIRAI